MNELPLLKRPRRWTEERQFMAGRVSRRPLASTTFLATATLDRDAHRVVPANCCRSMTPASSPLNGGCTSQAARGPMHTTRPERPLAAHGAEGRYSARTGRTGRNCAERLLRSFRYSRIRPRAAIHLVNGSTAGPREPVLQRTVRNRSLGPAACSSSRAGVTSSLRAPTAPGS